MTDPLKAAWEEVRHLRVKAAQLTAESRQCRTLGDFENEKRFRFMADSVAEQGKKCDLLVKQCWREAYQHFVQAKELEAESGKHAAQAALLYAESARLSAEADAKEAQAYRLWVEAVYAHRGNVRIDFQEELA
jgi:hypothetical protein